jgi:hypothetical protein
MLNYLNNHNNFNFDHNNGKFPERVFFFLSFLKLYFFFVLFLATLDYLNDHGNDHNLDNNTRRHHQLEHAGGWK